MRMSEASARMHLRDSVREDDVDLAIKVCIKMDVQHIQHHDILFVSSHCISLRAMLCFATDRFSLPILSYPILP